MIVHREVVESVARAWGASPPGTTWPARWKEQFPNREGSATEGEKGTA